MLTFKPAPGEELLYSDLAVALTTHRLVVGSEQVLLSAVSSANPAYSPHWPALALALWLVHCLAMAVGVWAALGWDVAGAGWAACAGIVAALAGFLWCRAATAPRVRVAHAGGAVCFSHEKADALCQAVVAAALGHRDEAALDRLREPRRPWYPLHTAPQQRHERP